ncbi:MAG TPA: hypothetical protein VN756_05925 [Solirubrobacterales bacterium]|nr:hypothetical protein [Solirubrobacterales bacterium]
MPAPHSPDLYDRIGSLVEASGPAGKAIVASVGAYLLGSLLSAIIFGAARLFNERWSRWVTRNMIGVEIDKPPVPLGAIDAHEGTEVEIGDMLSLSDFEGIEQIVGTLDFSLMRSIEEMIDRELGPERRRLSSAVEWAASQSRGYATVHLFRRSNVPTVRLGSIEGAGGLDSDFVIPTFSVQRDLFHERATLRARLVEHAETIGLKIERLHSEAEFRLAVAAPLAALVLLLSTETLLWLPALLVPLALVAQGLVLVRQSNRALMGALGAQSSADDLDRVTPVFSRYRADARALSDAIRARHWPSGNAVADESGPAGEAGDLAPAG